LVYKVAIPFDYYSYYVTIFSCTAVCIDPAKYLPKLKTANLNVCADESHYIVS